MEYTIDQLARMAGVSTRTLRYYDQVELLKPARINASGYRIYGQDQVNRLQQILLYRGLGMALGAIKAVLDEPGFDALGALRAHLTALEGRRAQLGRLIDTVQLTIEHLEGGRAMQDDLKFAGLKKGLIDQNERTHGSEARAQYGDDAVDRGNELLMNMNAQDYEKMQSVEADRKARREQAVTTQLPAVGEEGAAVYALHKAWLGFTWPAVSPEAHKGLADMYVQDDRFTAYYDARVPGCAAFLRGAVHAHA